jgi:hypothetical protein
MRDVSAEHLAFPVSVKCPLLAAVAGAITCLEVGSSNWLIHSPLLLGKSDIVSEEVKNERVVRKKYGRRERHEEKEREKRRELIKNTGLKFIHKRVQ